MLFLIWFNETLQKKNWDRDHLLYGYFTWKLQFSRVGFICGKAPVRPRRARRIVIRREKVKMQSVQRSSFLASVSQEHGKYPLLRESDLDAFSSVFRHCYACVSVITVTTFLWEVRVAPAEEVERLHPRAFPSASTFKNLSTPHAASSKSFICNMSR